jgi:hypothetical protein
MSALADAANLRHSAIILGLNQAILTESCKFYTWK